MNENTTYSAGILHAWVKDSNGVEHDIDAIMSVNAEPDMEETPVNGDDEVKATFYSNQRLNITISANALSFDAFAAMTGQTVTEVAENTTPGSEAPASKEIAGGVAGERNAPFVELGAVSVSQESNGDESHYVRIFHKVQCRRVSPPQENATELNATFEAVAYPTSVDIEGVALPSKRTDTLRVIDGPYLGA